VDQQSAFSFHGITFVTAYPVLPWIGVMASGYCLATVFEWQARRRRIFLMLTGFGLAAAFIVLRTVNIYGDPTRWTHQGSPVFTALSFLNVTKYPPSLSFLFMTLGPALLVMAWLETFDFNFTNPLIVFGRVPFFYYGAHLFLAHLIAIAMNVVRYGPKAFLLLAPPSMETPIRLFPIDYGFPLWTVYAVWVVVLLLVYPACLRFARFKQRRHEWWLTYL
jgi:uncharacterized membrane protein